VDEQAERGLGPATLLGPVRVVLMDGFGLSEDRTHVELPLGSQRLMAFLALRGQRVRRAFVAGTLWPKASEVRAHASLRSALARLGVLSPRAVEAGVLDVALSVGTEVDLRVAQSVAHGVLRPGAGAPPLRAVEATIATLSAELLPGWYDDWAVLEAENWRQLRLHALEVLAHGLCAAGRFADAANAASQAVGADPLRESAHATVITVHLAEGNQSEAIREFDRYRQLLLAEMGIEPTPHLGALLPARHGR
jgi:DNA-binding SARP family transcriptional activator